ncbi:MAG TPA: hypothetical protein VEW05_12920 [Candidatus Polarisedimenticolia bacterium]|nr:hypothetical protein [Candidatus Polarisedimenticolia bacterium]
MERRDFLKVLPLSALAPKVVKEGVLSLELPHNSHLLFIVDEYSVINDDWYQNKDIMPPGATGGAIVYVRGNPEDAIKIYRLDEPEKV